MPRMAKKKPKPPPSPTTEGDPVPTLEKKDRHKPRRTLAIPPEMYAAFAVLAKRNGRPILWEARRALIDHLKKNGLWPYDPAIHGTPDDFTDE
jgi:hypothetical protein